MSIAIQKQKFKVHKHQIINTILGLELALKSLSEESMAGSECVEEIILEVEEYFYSMKSNWLGCKEALKNN